jgi:hypothetical protein
MRKPEGTAAVIKCPNLLRKNICILNPQERLCNNSKHDIAALESLELVIYE